MPLRKKFFSPLSPWFVFCTFGHFVFVCFFVFFDIIKEGLWLPSPPPPKKMAFFHGNEQMFIPAVQKKLIFACLFVCLFVCFKWWRCDDVFLLCHVAKFNMFIVSHMHDINLKMLQIWIKYYFQLSIEIPSNAAGLVYLVSGLLCGLRYVGLLVQKSICGNVKWQKICENGKLKVI